jgi:hypothetical protein
LLFCTSLPAAEIPPAAKVQIIQLENGQSLSGTVKVYVGIIPVEKARIPEQAYVGLGRPPWIVRDKDHTYLAAAPSMFTLST